MVSPRITVNSPTVVMFLPLRCTGVRSSTMSGPAIARSTPLSRRVIHGAIAEAQNQLGMHAHAAARAVNQAHDLGALAVEGHEIDQNYGTVCRLKARFKDERVGAIFARDAGLVARRHQPAAVIAVAEQ